MTSEELKIRRKAEIATYPKIQEFDGIRFVRDDDHGYYRGFRRMQKSLL